MTDIPPAPAVVPGSWPLAAGGVTQRGARTQLKRVVRAVALTSIVVLSLLCFPSHVAWLLAFWLLWHTVLTARSKPGWVPLLTCAAILLAKRVYWAPALVAFVGVAVGVTLWRATRFGKTKRSLWETWLPTVCLWGVWLWMALQWQAIARCNHVVHFDSARPIVCVGDSLTSGLLPDPGYPASLDELVSLPVVNLGQSGISTQGGLERLPRIQKLNPQVVVIELGGHDFLQGRTRAATKQNLEQLIAACRELGAEVVLCEIPRGFMTDPFAGLERELADDNDLELVPDAAIRQLVLWSPISPPGMWLPGTHLSDDGIHTNARGSRFVARCVADALERMYGPQVRATQEKDTELPGDPSR